jgi:hypothetical protein
MTTIRNLLVVSLCAVALVACTKAEGGDAKGGEAQASEAETTQPKASGDEAAIRPEEPVDEGAKKPADEAAPKPANLTDDQIGAGIVKMVDDMAAAQKAATTVEQKDGKEESKIDCDQVADAWKAILDRNQGVLAAARELDAHHERATALEKKYGKDLETKIGGLGPVLKQCAKNENVKSTLKAFNPKKEEGKGGGH